jgi:myo-inositol 2-dehydrogenase/D-chiro-inositol 1-dehydrogenase
MDRYIQAYATEVKEFCAAVLNNGEISVGGKDGLLAVAIGLAAKKSCAEKKTC